MTHIWGSTAWDDYLYWQEQDRRTLKRVSDLLKDITSAAQDDRPNEGIGKPEALNPGLHGYWSRRISDEHRLIYKVVDNEIRIAACRYHYED